jgi:hypothetical protein
MVKKNKKGNDKLDDRELLTLNERMRKKIMAERKKK